ncbi:MAG: response regulator, partial [Deltaproteobacteria bacterium]|nr:response regulator [Deltaproteobacteria bacterium]
MEKKTILIVDDEIDILETFTFVLEKEGYQCLTARDGLDALNKARDEKPSLILLDVMLPKMNGYKVARLLKFDEKFRHIPIIMITAKRQESDRELGVETGVDAYITKPIEPKVLLEEIRKH